MNNSQTLILSIFHDVETYVPGKSGSKGIFIIGKDSGTFFFKWSQYLQLDPIPKIQINKNLSPSSSRSQIEYFHQIYLTSDQIQKIILTPTPSVADMLISTFDPPEMHQFLFKSNPMESSLQFLQVLGINSALLENPIITSDFWRNTIITNANTYSSFSTLARVFDISCENGKFNVPYIQIASSINSIPLVDELTKVKIASKFGISGSQFIKNSLALTDFQQIVGSGINFSDLRIQASRRGISKELRPYLWPQLLNILPFSKDTSQILQFRVKEYFIIKKQWQSLSNFQLHHRQELRSSYQTIRMDVRRTNLPLNVDEKKFRTIMTDILKTYAIWNYDVRYTQGLNDILLPFLLVIYDSKTSQYSDEEKEALSFWCFSSFLEKIESALVEKSMDGVMSQDLPFVLNLLNKTDETISK